MLHLDLSRRTFLQRGGAACLAGTFSGARGGLAAPPTPRIARAEDARSLRQLADDLGIHLGTALSGWNFEAEDRKLREKYRKIVLRDFNLVVIQYGLFWSTLEPKEGEYDFSIADPRVNWAHESKLAICGHTLLFGTFDDSIPGWLQKARLTKAEMIKRLQDHITRVVKRYQGKIKYWIVTNEPYHPPFRTKDFFAERIGPEYVRIAFEAARAADKDALLIYNDTNNHTLTEHAHGLTRRNVKMLQAKKLVDIVGMQMHLDARSVPRKKEVIEAMKPFNLPVWVTELDLSMAGVEKDRKKRFEIQARLYKPVIEGCLESGKCKAISVWDIGDQYSWLVKATPGNPGVASDASPTLFDDDLEPKPAYKTVRDVLLARIAARSKKR